MYHILPDCPKWLDIKLRILSAYDPEQVRIYGDTVFAVMFGGVYGPMVEPLTVDIASDTKPIQQVVDDIARRDPTRIWREYRSTKEDLARDMSIGVKDGQACIFYHDQNAWMCLQNGVVAAQDVKILRRTSCD